MAKFPYDVQILPVLKGFRAIKTSQILLWISAAAIAVGGVTIVVVKSRPDVPAGSQRMISADLRAPEAVTGVRMVFVVLRFPSIRSRPDTIGRPHANIAHTLHHIRHAASPCQHRGGHSSLCTLHHGSFPASDCIGIATVIFKRRTAIIIIDSQHHRHCIASCHCPESR